MPAHEQIPCHCLKCRGALVGKSTARQHTAQSQMGGAPTVQSVPQWLVQNAASSSRLDAGEEPAAEKDQDEEFEIRPSKRTRVDEDQCELLVGSIHYLNFSEIFTFYMKEPDLRIYDNQVNIQRSEEPEVCIT